MNDDLRKMPMWENPHLQRELADAELSMTAHRWLPGDPIPYDEMRAILGLPDVRDEVMRTRAEVTRQLGAFAFGERWGRDRPEWTIGVDLPYVHVGDGAPPESAEWRMIRLPSGSEVRVSGRPSGWAGIQLRQPLTEDERRAISESFRRLGLAVQDWQLRLLEHMAEVGKAARSIAQTLDSLTPEDRRPHPLHPAIPRPSHTPPVWAIDPTRTRRRRNR